MADDLEEEALRFEWKVPQSPAHVQLFHIALNALGVTLLCAILGLPVVLFAAYLVGYTPTTFTNEMMYSSWFLMSISCGLFTACCMGIHYRQIKHWVQFWPCGSFRTQYGNHLRKKKRYPHANADWRKFTHLDTQQLQNGQTRLRFVHRDGYFIYIPGSYDQEWTSFLHMQILKRFDKMRARQAVRGEPKATFWAVPDRSLTMRLGVGMAVAAACGVMVVMFGQPFLPSLNPAKSDIVFIRKSADQISLIYPFVMAALAAFLVGRLGYSFVSRAKKYEAWFFANGDFFTREPRWWNRTLDRHDKWKAFTQLTQETSRGGSVRLRFEQEDGTFFDLPSRLKKRQADSVQQQIKELWDAMKAKHGGSPPPDGTSGIPVTQDDARERYGI